MGVPLQELSLKQELYELLQHSGRVRSLGSLLLMIYYCCKLHTDRNKQTPHKDVVLVTFFKDESSVVVVFNSQHN